MSNALQVTDLDLDGLAAREWLVANGIGGYASSTVAGMNTRRYHGLLVAAMAPPVRRMVLLSRVEETLLCDGREFYLACNEYPGVIWPRGHDHVRAFSNDPFPRWGYQGDGWTLEKQVRLLRGENTVLVSYTLWGGMNTADLELRPLLAMRPMHDLSYQWNGRLRAEPRGRGHHHVAATSRTPEVFFAHDGTFEQRPNWYLNTIYRREQERGYPGLEDLWCPGVVKVRLMPGQAVYFACSADPFELSHVINRASRQLSPAVDLQLRTAPVAGPVLKPKATQPTSQPAGKPVEAAGAPTADADYDALVRATEPFILTTRLGDSAGCTVQYPWNAPSPRPALAGFAGIYLVPNRIADARSLLLALVPRLRDGLLPTEFPEDGSEPVYAGADVALWFVNAVYEYLAYTGDAPTVRRHLLDSVFAIIEHYQRGTDLGIRADADGLLASGVAGVGVTWMDAKSGDWVATPRQGRAVEVNALWYNALCVAAELARRFEGPDRVDRSAEYAALARAAREAFNRRFWNEAAGCCFDVVGDDDSTADASIRPNQLLAISLPFAVLSPDRHGRVVERVRQELLTPAGVRTRAPSDPHYQGRYEGDAIARDRAYHNGPAFPWLLGPMVTALVRTFGRGPAVLEQARAMLRPSLDRLRGDGLGLLRELFDGDAPHVPGGATTAPLAVGEILRCYAEDLLGRNPALPPRPPAGEAAPQSPQQPVPPDVMHPA